jgi:sodium/hydrogen antiporter
VDRRLPARRSLRLLAEATLALVLFSDASRIDLRAWRDGYAVPARLVGVVLPLTSVAGTLAAIWCCRSRRWRRRWCSRSCWPRPTPRSVRRS